jgi:hypothetical protein
VPGERQDVLLQGIRVASVPVEGVRCQVSGVRVQGSGFRVQGSGFRVQGSGFRVQGSGFRVQGSGFRVEKLINALPQILFIYTVLLL